MITKFFGFNRIRRFITVFKIAATEASSEPIKCGPLSHIVFIKDGDYPLVPLRWSSLVSCWVTLCPFCAHRILSEGTVCCLENSSFFKSSGTAAHFVRVIVKSAIILLINFLRLTHWMDGPVLYCWTSS